MDSGLAVIADENQSIMWRVGTRRVCSGELNVFFEN